MAYILSLTPDPITSNYISVGYDSTVPEFKRTAQSFQFTTAPTITGAEVHIRSNTTTGEELTVRIETDDGNKPSGILAHANLTATIAGFNNTTFSWKTVTFTAATLLANTKYWLVLKSTTESGTPDGYRHLLTDPANEYADGSRSAFSSSAWSTHASNDISVRLEGTLAAAAVDQGHSYFM